MSGVNEEVVKALESMGHLEEAEQLQKELDLSTNPDHTTTRNLLIYVLAKTMEQEMCSKQQFPCSVCVFQARKIAPIVISLMEKMSVHSFINIVKEQDIRKIILFAFNYAVSSVKRKLLENKSQLVQWKEVVVPSVGSPKEDTAPKIIRISEQDNGQ